MFDLMHAAHVQAIKRAKSLGDYLIIHVASDKMAKKKGKNRPIIPEKERIFILSELRDVDRVICYPDLDKLDLPLLLNDTKPDIIVLNNGERKFNEDEECKKRGIKIVEFPPYITASELNTTKIINQIKKGG